MGYSPAALFRLFSESLWCGGLLLLLFEIFSFPRLLLLHRSEELSEGMSPALARMLAGGDRWGTRNSRPHKTFRFFEDLIFCLSAAVALLLLAFVGNEGRIRWVSPVGMIFGFLAFRALFGRAMQRILRILALLVRRVLRTVFVPFYAFFRVARRGILKISAGIFMKRREQRQKADPETPSSDENLKNRKKKEKGGDESDRPRKGSECRSGSRERKT